jgi:Ca2+-binding EF-hand superfamily protein
LTFLQDFGVGLSSAEVGTMFKEYDGDGNGSIDFEEFLSKVRGPMPAKRRAVVEKAFETFDRTGDGQVNYDDLKDAYNASKHPDVTSGRRKESEVLIEWLQTFEVGGTVNGVVTREEFVNYYHNVSASIDLDDYFVLMMEPWFSPKNQRKGWSNKGQESKGGSVTARGSGGQFGAANRVSGPFSRAQVAGISGSNVGALSHRGPGLMKRQPGGNVAPRRANPRTMQQY